MQAAIPHIQFNQIFHFAIEQNVCSHRCDLLDTTENIHQHFDPVASEIEHN